MCSKPTRSSLRLRSKKRNTLNTIITTTKTSSSSKKSKTKTKKHKYISLQHDLSFNDSSTTNDESAEQTHHHHHYNYQEQVEVPELLNLFKEEEKEENINNVVAYNFFDCCTQETTSLNGLIGCRAEEEGTVCPSLAYGYSDGGTRTSTNSLSLELERSALRGGGGGEREVREEKWVCYEEVTSCTVPSEYGKKLIKKENGEDENGRRRKRRLLLSLKLDYDQIMNAWSNKGPLYINHHGTGNGSDESQIVPNLQLDDILGCHDSTTNNVFLDVGNLPLLRVPEDGDSLMDNTDVEVWKHAHREARVLRYKEKRQNRLFSKRIRYEVRKLNAEKRPRIKGRFVKRS
ncbi:Zinc finger protein constans-like [Thalictrum thalictroides]|uniref:Zinc finger protein constans-like n=1 Tax=Thalictrum thalictroides TaxID=46969 RepID=A0A7J6W391_THATH|nr:Zinc finger protein constans-like [Thalictrum thalictroides]